MKTRHRYFVYAGVANNKGKELSKIRVSVSPNISIDRLISTIRVSCNLPPESNKWCLIAYRRSGGSLTNAKWKCIGGYAIRTFKPVYITFRLMSWVGNDFAFKFVLKPHDT
jgi:hypothetical protein